MASKIMKFLLRDADAAAGRMLPQLLTKESGYDRCLSSAIAKGLMSGYRESSSLSSLRPNISVKPAYNLNPEHAE